MLADTAKLAIELNLTGNAKAGIAGVERSLSSLNRSTGQIQQGFKTMGAGIGVAFRNIALIAVPVVAGLTAGLIKSIKEGQEAAKVQTIYANAIANSGKVSTQYVKILNDQQTALMNLAGMDDEAIKSAQTRLIQMGLTGEQVAKVTPLVLDFAKATGIDLDTAAKLAGKSISGNIGALSRYGVAVDKAKAKVDPFAATVDALNGKFGGTTKALSGSLEARLGALREGLANVREEAGMKLLPVLTKIVDVAGRKLVPAFSSFIDRVLPSIITGLDKFAEILENGGAEKAIKGITDALAPMVELLKIAAAPIKAIVQAFLSLPSQVQGVLIAGFAVNKLSGGLIGQGIGQVAGGLLQRGSSPANPVFVSDVTGGLGGALKGAGGAAASGEAAAVASGLLAPGIASLVAAIATPIIMFNVIPQLVSRKGGNELTPGRRLGLPDSVSQTYASIGLTNLLAQNGGGAGMVGNIGRHAGPMPVAITSITARSAREWAQGSRRQGATSEQAVLQRAIAAGFHPSAAAIQRTLDKNISHLDAIKAAVDRVTGAVKGIRINTYVPGQKQSGVTHAPGTGPLVGATGLSGLTRGPTGMIVGEAGNEFVAVLRNPRAASSQSMTTSLNVTVTNPIKDTLDKTVVRSRWGQTAAQAGAG